MKLPPYPDYKDSGVPWLGEIPTHWNILRAKYLLKELDSRWAHEKGELLSVSQYTGVTRRKLKENSDEPDTRSASLVGYKVVQEDDLAVNIMLAWNGSLGISKHNGVISPAYCVYRFLGGTPWYYHYLLKTPLYRSEIKKLSRGVVDSRLRLYTENLYRIPLLSFHNWEHEHIVRFIDWKVSQINKFIRNKRRLIALLKEQKQNIINKAVTRGINPNVKLKPSGVDWIGDIPEHWEVLRLKYQFREIDERSTTGTETLLSMRMNAGLVPHNFVSDKPILPEELIGFKRVYPGQMIMNRMRASIGMFAQVTDAGLVSPDYAIFLPIRPTCLQYFCYLFKNSAVKATLRKESKGLGTGESGFLRLYSDSFGRIKVAIPPLAEQQQIIEWIEISSSSINTAITKAERQIQLMTEYRDRLIADVVTGKVDVRGVTVPEVMEEELPDLMDGEDLSDIEFEDTLEENEA